MAGPNMKRDQSLAGQSVKQGGYTVTYDDMGYATGAVRDGGASATSTKKTTNANNSPTHQAAYQAAQQGDWDRVGTLVNGLAVDAGYGDGSLSMKDANAYLGELQDEFLYDPNEYYKGQYEKAFGEGSWEGNSGGRMALTTGSRGNGYGGYGSFEDFVNGMGYYDYEEQTRKYIQAAVANAVNGYNRQIETVNRDTQNMARQAYIANMMGQKNMDQQLSASGLAGGMADSQRIGLQANYENNLNELEMQRQATVAELQLAIENARLTGDMQTAQELAGYLQQLQGQWVNYIQNQQQLENQNYWNNLNMQQENQNTARNWVLTMIQNGTLPDEATLTAAGMTTAEAKNMLNYVRQQSAPRYTAPVVEPVETEEDRLIAAISAYSQMGKQPMSENEVRSLWNGGYDFTDYAAGIPALQQYYTAQGVTSRPADDSGMTLEQLDERQITNSQNTNGVSLARPGGTPRFTTWAELGELMASGKAYARDAGNGKYTLVYNG